MKKKQGQHMALHIITGTMFGGKTIELLTRLKLTPGLVVNHSRDIRYGTYCIASHNGDTSPSVSISNIEDLFTTPAYTEHEHIYIDEAQFFINLKDNVLRMVEKDNKTVTCSGLLVDTNRNTFGELLSLVPFTDSCVFKYPICSKCDKKAIFTSKTSDFDKRIDICSEKYVPKCRCHYLSVDGVY